MSLCLAYFVAEDDGPSKIFLEIDLELDLQQDIQEIRALLDEGETPLS